MRISISNIAWDVTEDEAVANLLNKYAIDAIDVAPGKYFPDPEAASETEIERVRSWWKLHGIEITGMQSLLFGTTGLNLFGSDDIQAKMLKHLASVCRIGHGLGASNLVFGSPKNRIRPEINDNVIFDLAVSFFNRLGDISAKHGLSICLEPNPTCYGANFMTNTEETAHIVKTLSHPFIRMQLDTGAMNINNENGFEIISNYAPIIGHVHASEPELLTLGDGDTDHELVAKTLETYLPEKVVAIEMLPNKRESNLKAIERALVFAKLKYSGTNYVRMGLA